MAQAWPRPPMAIACGRATGVNSTTFTTVAFPAGRFTATPRVTATINDGGYASIQIKSVSTSSFQVAVSAGSGILVDWIAIQP